MKEPIEELRGALAELESEDGLESFVEGHGLHSRYFTFSWRSEHIEINFRLPYGRVLSDEDEQAIDAARIGAAIRLAILMLALDAKGLLLDEGEAKISVSAEDSEATYSILGGDGEEIDAGEDWEPLIARINASLPDEESGLQIIWP